MRMSIGAFSLAASVVLGAGSVESQQLREDSYRWYINPQAGIMLFQTQRQDYSAIPIGGLHALIMGKRGGVLLGVEEAFGSDELSAFADASAPNGAREVLFDRLRKYSAALMAFPVRGQAEPYIGLGFGILHTVGTEPQGFFTDADDAALAEAEAKERGSTGFASLLGGVQFRAGSSTRVFLQYQVTTSPSSGSLLDGPTHTFSGGLRFSLGKAKEDIKGGGY